MMLAGLGKIAVILKQGELPLISFRHDGYPTVKAVDTSEVNDQGVVCPAPPNKQHHFPLSVAMQLLKYPCVRVQMIFKS